MPNYLDLNQCYFCSFRSWVRKEACLCVYRESDRVGVKETVEKSGKSLTFGQLGNLYILYFFILFLQLFSQSEMIKTVT